MWGRRGGVILFLNFGGATSIHQWVQLSSIIRQCDENVNIQYLPCHNRKGFANFPIINISSYYCYIWILKWLERLLKGILLSLQANGWKVEPVCGYWCYRRQQPSQKELVCVCFCWSPWRRESGGPSIWNIDGWCWYISCNYIKCWIYFRWT